MFEFIYAAIAMVCVGLTALVLLRFRRKLSEWPKLVLSMSIFGLVVCIRLSLVLHEIVRNQIWLDRMQLVLFAAIFVSSSFRVWKAALKS
jgi:hypothetical protein